LFSHSNAVSSAELNNGEKFDFMNLPIHTFSQTDN
jgi:hypothetical protein